MTPRRYNRILLAISSSLVLCLAVTRPVLGFDLGQCLAQCSASNDLAGCQCDCYRQECMDYTDPIQPAHQLKCLPILVQTASEDDESPCEPDGFYESDKCSTPDDAGPGRYYCGAPEDPPGVSRGFRHWAWPTPEVPQGAGIPLCPKNTEWEFCWYKGRGGNRVEIVAGRGCGGIGGESVDGCIWLDDPDAHSLKSDPDHGKHLVQPLTSSAVEKIWVQSNPSTYLGNGLYVSAVNKGSDCGSHVEVGLTPCTCNTIPGPLGNFSGYIKVSATGPIPDGRKSASVKIWMLVHYGEGCYFEGCEGCPGAEGSRYYKVVTASVSVVAPKEECGSCSSCLEQGGARVCPSDGNQPSSLACKIIEVKGRPFACAEAPPFRFLVKGVIASASVTHSFVEPVNPLYATWSSQGRWSVSAQFLTDGTEHWTELSTMTVTDRMTGNLYRLASPLRQPDAFEWDDTTITLEKASNHSVRQTSCAVAMRGDQYNLIDYVYDPRPPGGTIWYSYDSNNSLTKLSVGPTGQKQDAMYVAYSSTGRLTQLSAACGSCGQTARSYEYDKWDHITLAKNAAGFVTERSEYDYTTGLCTKVSSGPDEARLVRSQVAYDYDYAHGTFRVPQLVKLEHVYNGVARVQVEEFTGEFYDKPNTVYVYPELNADPSSGQRFSTAYRYEVDGNASITKSYSISHNQVTRAEYYDTATNMVTMQTVQSSAGVITLSTQAWNTSADDAPLIAQSIDTRGQTHEYDYDYKDLSAPVGEPVIRIKGLLSRDIVSDGTTALTSRYEYGDNRQVTKEWKEASGSPCPTCTTTVYGYDQCDNLTKVTEAYQTSVEKNTWYCYDLFNRRTKTQDALGTVHGSFYNIGGQLLSEVTYAAREALGSQTPAAESGNVVSQTRYEYDANGKMTRQLVAADPGTPADPGVFGYGTPAAWRTTAYQYDDYGRQKAVIEDEAGLHATTWYEYNNQDEVVRVITPGGVWTETVRDGRGLEVMQIVGFERCTAAQQMTTTYVYDGDSNLIQTTSPAGAVTVYEYDGFGRRTKTIEQ